MTAPPRLADRPEADVIVVGSGAAGFAAALTARLKGLDTVLLEKAPVLGGTTAVSGGMLWVPMSPVARRAGVKDSLDRARSYFREVTGAAFDAPRAEAFLQAGPEMVAFLEDRAGLGFTLATDRPDYYDTPSATTGTRSISPAAFDGRLLGPAVANLRPPARETTFLGMMMRPASDLHHFINVFKSFRSFRFVVWRLAVLARDKLRYGRSMLLAGGNALIAASYRAALDRGVRIHAGVPAKRLIVENGRVAGVVVEENGQEVSLRARHGVVLAAGGFPHDIARRRDQYEHAPTGAEHLSPAPPENTGDGIRMAEAVGAAVPHLSDAACWAPTSLVSHRDGTRGVFPHLIDRQKPGFIAVTDNGRRFVNESHSYHEFGRGLRRSAPPGTALHCWLIADHRTVRRFGMGFAKPAPVPLGRYVRSGYLLSGQTLADLAAQAGIDPAGLETTVRRFNDHARAGEDPDFRRGTTPYNRYLGDRYNAPNPCLGPIERAPFYALRLNMGELGTFGGLATDADAAVLDGAGKVIPGLYAAGNDMSHVMGGNYLGGGAAIGPAMVFGYIAARDIARRAEGANRAD